MYFEEIYQSDNNSMVNIPIKHGVSVRQSGRQCNFTANISHYGNKSPFQPFRADHS